ncbi:hypothetical protein GE09DRAFT_1219056 [Coniochaeta sp. 2T2.1]|nr:hypothetical protein GE09DRAFT_1219056 [Coniochaeta sp. 2T2.1]
MPPGDLGFDEATAESTMQHIPPVSGVAAPKKKAVTPRATLRGRINRRHEGNKRPPGRPPNEPFVRPKPEQWRRLACAPPARSTTGASATATPALAPPTARPGPGYELDDAEEEDKFLGIPMLQGMALPSSGQQTPIFSTNDFAVPADRVSLSYSPFTTPYPTLIPNTQFPSAQSADPLNRFGSSQQDHPPFFKPEKRYTTMKVYTYLLNNTTFEVDTIVTCTAGRRTTIEKWLADTVCATQKGGTGPNGPETVATFFVELDGRAEYLLEAIVVPNSGTSGPNGPVGLHLSPQEFTNLFVHEGHRCPPGQPVVPPPTQRPVATTRGLCPGFAQSGSGLGDNDPPLQGQPMNPMNQGEFGYNNIDDYSTIR